MEHVQQFHEYLLRQRTQIRNHRRTLQAMKACWKLLHRTDPNTMTREEYEGMYSTLLYELTICWDEETNDAVLAKMWHRDASSFPNLDFNRFCCSIFFFVEVWVQEIKQEAYDRVFGIIQTILAGQEYDHIPSSTDSNESNFKPTLESFSDAFDRDRDLESMNLNIGKSIIFNAKKYFQHFGLPQDTIEASNSQRYGHYEGATATKRPKSGCSNPQLLRPASSRQSRLSVYNSSATAPQRSPSVNAPRTTNAFLLAGTIALKPSQ
ncbi:hypothetical protein F441_02467 [Phytophthora nicotianae CJ01A1]|uniref:Uncharacterized protein n=6 Tax=Phytophthora nicotianae TaxID=4792 RepID=W2QSB4_PHYN3|nr:hypothetical protein PPTG_07338 [Phytophthora nicotianae INRA-310]ETI54732.1 hypothetical protein F443_02527 [Phytophthora nicotianae P1569]ETK94597.1 hypothetical protein L915_02402 [Phytophthora nicotianae]ETO83494.1 hypothetical protein F444_02518 [Phytophthora nicotianae P1976]ETP24582.1 hypothetical protein F441_02467 [Phytophthora nicotianae CJ01A1]ETP52521.1 hypothetical protein F442_02498 [Phytophthora nicotianae P10297]KUF83210.1 hypothetical protein AM587_10012849 [Phytophthora n